MAYRDVGGITVAETGFSDGEESVLTLHLKNETELYAHYMSFVQGGAIFVPTKISRELGDNFFFVLSTYLQVDPIPISGAVVWITQMGSSSSKKEGVGVQFTGEQAALKMQIEQALTGTANYHPTLTI